MPECPAGLVAGGGGSWIALVEPIPLITEVQAYPGQEGTHAGETQMIIGDSNLHPGGRLQKPASSGRADEQAADRRLVDAMV
jgi:hypothetical protein